MWICFNHLLVTYVKEKYDLDNSSSVLGKNQLRDLRWILWVHFWTCWVCSCSREPILKYQRYKYQRRTFWKSYVSKPLLCLCYYSCFSPDLLDTSRSIGTLPFQGRIWKKYSVSRANLKDNLLEHFFFQHLNFFLFIQFWSLPSEYSWWSTS